MNTKTTPKDFFLHLGATIALYTVAIAFINLAFTAIDRILPDALNNYFNANSLIWPISMLIVVAPILYLLEWMIARDILKIVEKSEVWIRKWRIYLTLFLAGVSMVVDLIVLINTYLSGEITSRFIYKVLVILVVSGIIFAYYILAKSTPSPKGNRWLMILSWSGIVIIAAVIVGGFIVVGSPTKQRTLRFDQQRVSDLTDIQYKVLDYANKNGKIPSTLSELANSGIRVPLDPRSNNSYEYTPITSLGGFELCATFSLPSINDNFSKPYAVPTSPLSFRYNWDHGAGRVCFSQDITEQITPVVPVKALK